MIEKAVFGERYRDVVSGFTGVVVARADYQYEASSALVVAETRQAASDSRWIQESRLEPVPPGATGFGS